MREKRSPSKGAMVTRREAMPGLAQLSERLLSPLLYTSLSVCGYTEHLTDFKSIKNNPKVKKNKKEK